MYCLASKHTKKTSHRNYFAAATKSTVIEVTINYYVKRSTIGYHSNSCGLLLY